MSFIYPLMPGMSDRNIYSSPKTSYYNDTDNSLYKISEEIVPMGESIRFAQAHKNIIFTFSTKETEATIYRESQKITIDIPFEKNELHIEITNKGNGILQIEMIKNNKSMGKLCGNLVIIENESITSITIVNEKEKKSIKVESKPDNTFTVTDNCFDPGAYIKFKPIKPERK